MRGIVRIQKLVIHLSPMNQDLKHIIQATGNDNAHLNVSYELSISEYVLHCDPRFVPKTLQSAQALTGILHLNFSTPCT